MILEGKPVAEKVEQRVKEAVEALDFQPTLDVVKVGFDPASEIYVKKKVKKAGELGIKGEAHELPEDCPEEELLSLIEELNKKETGGMIVQLPLPVHLDAQKVVEAVSPARDADGLHPLNVGRLAQGSPSIVPATPKGVMEMLRHYGAELAGSEAIVVGRSSMVGKPVSYLLTNANATVTLCHSRTKGLAEHARRADVLVAAVGKPGIITAEMVKEGAFVVDVGINRVEGKVVGDVDFEGVSQRANVSPVPGGVGPLTVAMLMENVLECAKP